MVSEIWVILLDFMMGLSCAACSILCKDKLHIMALIGLNVYKLASNKLGNIMSVSMLLLDGHTNNGI